jgi:hypothetical protein
MMYEGCTDQKAIDKADVLSALQFGYTEGLSRLFDDLLVSDPEERPTSTEVFKHPTMQWWIKKLNLGYVDPEYTNSIENHPMKGGFDEEPKWESQDGNH